MERKPNIVFIPNIDLGEGRANPYQLSVDSWGLWASSQPNTKVVVWTEPILDPKIYPIILQRDWVLDILDNSNIEYDQVLIVDADTIVHPQCPDFFQLTDHKFSAVRNNGCYEWVQRSIKGWGDALFEGKTYFDLWDYFNTGFIIINEKHKPFMKELQDLYMSRGEEIKHHRKIIKASTGQTIVNFMTRKHGVEIQYLPEQYNFQDMFRKNLLHHPGHSWFTDELHFLDWAYVYHFNAMVSPDRATDYWMKRTYKELYGK